MTEPVYPPTAGQGWPQPELPDEQSPFPQPPAPEAPRTSWWQRLSQTAVFALVVAAVVVLAGIIALIIALTHGGQRDMQVSFSLDDFTGSSTCAGGVGGYSDIGPGTEVVIRDNDQHILGTARLGDGSSVNMAEAVGHAVGGCIWSTTVKGVPTGKDFYSIEVSHRGTQVYSADQLDKNGWKVELTLGGS